MLATKMRNRRARSVSPEELAAIGAKHPRIQSRIIAGADHFYSGVRDKLIAQVEEWLGSLR